MAQLRAAVAQTTYVCTLRPVLTQTSLFPYYSKIPVLCLFEKVMLPFDFMMVCVKILCVLFLCAFKHLCLLNQW